MRISSVGFAFAVLLQLPTPASLPTRPSRILQGTKPLWTWRPTPTSACLLVAIGPVSNSSELRCWGRNEHGAAGMGVTDDYLGDDESLTSFPPLVLPSGAIELSTSTSHSCVLLDSGQLSCWGGGANGGLGFPWDSWLGDDEDPLAGPTVDAGSSIVQVVAAPDNVTCVLLEDGAVKCWGTGEHGATGQATTENLCDQADETPSGLESLELGGPARQLAGARHHACAVLVDGSVRCWGRDRHGSLGLASGPLVLGDDEVPTTVAPIRLPGEGVTAVAAQGRQVCALHTDGAVTCWGETGPWLGYGPALDQLGEGYGDDEHPDVLGHVPIGGPVTKLAVGDAFTCALLESSEVKCWGASQLGQLGYGNTNFVGYAETPADVEPLAVGGAVVDLVAGWNHACALLQSGDIRCWGEGIQGALGRGTPDNVGDDELPGDVPPIVLD